MGGVDLTGVRIAILTNYRVLRDGRTRKEARTLAEAGAVVSVIGYGRGDEALLAGEPYEPVLLERPVPKSRRWGHESVWWPARVVVNTICNALQDLLPRVMPGLWARTRLMDGEMVSAVVQRRPDVVHAHNVSTAAAVKRILRYRRVPVIYDAEELFDGYYADDESGRRAQRVADWAERYLAKKAAAIITVSPLIARYLATKMTRDDVTVVLNSLYSEEVSPGSVGTPVRLLNQSLIRKVAHDHLLVEAMVHLRGLATLTMMGHCIEPDYEEMIRGLIREHRLEDTVTLTGAYDPLESIQLAQGFDIGVASYRADTLSKDYTLANRFFTYLGAGLALAMPDVAAHRVFPGYDHFGILLDTSSSEALAASLRPLILDPARIETLKASAYQASCHYSWEQQEPVLLSVYDRILSTAGGDSPR